MSKKIKLTETQLKKVVNIISESSFDEMITKYNDTKQREVGMSHDDATMLVNIATNWCEGKDNLPDCQEIQKIKNKLNLY